MDELDAIDRLAPDWIHLLLWLREEPQPHQRAPAGNARRTEAQSVDHQATCRCNASTSCRHRNFGAPTERNHTIPIGTLLALVHRVRGDPRAACARAETAAQIHYAQNFTPPENIPPDFN
jgi:hypothetical protein